jgi:hypothetical protein
MGDPDCGRILSQFEVASAPQLFQLTGVVSLGVEDVDESSRATVESLTLCEPDLLPQPFSLEEW